MKLIESFFWGIIAALAALVIEFLLYAYAATPTGATEIFYNPYFVIGTVAIEEFFKYLLIAKIIKKYSHNRSHIYNSLLLGIGFFISEFMVTKYSGTSYMNREIFQIAILHAGTAGIIGYIIATRGSRTILAALYAIASGIIFHACYNLLFAINASGTFGLNIPNPDNAILILLTILAIVNAVNLAGINGKLAQESQRIV